MRSNGSAAWMYFDSLVFIAHRGGSMQQTDFAEYLADMYAHEGITGAIVMPNDTAPSPGQRAEIQRWFEASGARVAVVSESLLVRGAVTALSWFALPIRSFTLDRIDAALLYVAVPAERREPAKRALRSLTESFTTDHRLAL